MSADVDVAIIGAGRGHAAARRLATSYLSATVLEATARVGGRAWTYDVAGIRRSSGDSVRQTSAEGSPAWLTFSGKAPLLATTTGSRSAAREAGFWLFVFLFFQCIDQIRTRRASEFRKSVRQSPARDPMTAC